MSVVRLGSHGPLLTVHWKMCSPTVSPVTALAGSFGSRMLPVPLTSVHVPMAGAMMALPCRLVAAAAPVGVQSS